MLGVREEFMKSVIVASAILTLFAGGVCGQTNRADTVKNPPAPPSVSASPSPTVPASQPPPPPRPPLPPPPPPVSDGNINAYRIQTPEQAARRKVEIEGALARLRKRAALAEQPIPPGGVRARQDTDHLTTDPVLHEYTGYNFLTIKW